MLSNSLYKVKQSKLCNIVGSVRENNYALISNKETGVPNTVALSIQNDERLSLKTVLILMTIQKNLFGTVML